MNNIVTFQINNSSEISGGSTNTNEFTFTLAKPTGFTVNQIGFTDPSGNKVIFRMYPDKRMLNVLLIKLFETALWKLANGKKN